MLKDRIVKQQYRVCDICQERPSVQACVGCGEDLCSKCRLQDALDPWTGEWEGDYPPWLCERCRDIREPYASRARAIREEMETHIEAIRDAWKAECEAAARAADKKGSEK